MANQVFDTSALLKVEVHPDELSVLLERLAATEAMYGEPATTIRDVAELTEASPNLIARLLSEMRGEDEFEKLRQKVDSHDDRIEAVEEKVNRNPVIPQKTYYQVDLSTSQQSRETNPILSLIIFAIIALIMFGVFQANVSKMEERFFDRNRNLNQWPSFGGNDFPVREDRSITRRDRPSLMR